MGKKGLGGIKNLKAFPSCHGGVVGVRVRARVCALTLRGIDEQSTGRKKRIIDKIENSRWCSGGVVVLEG